VANVRYPVWPGVCNGGINVRNLVGFRLTGSNLTPFTGSIRVKSREFRVLFWTEKDR